MWTYRAALLSRPVDRTAARREFGAAFVDRTVAVMGEFVRVDKSGAVATVRFERPPMNALSVGLQDELRTVAGQLGADPAVRAVVLYGGPKVFAAGADVKEMAQMSHADMVARADTLSESLSTIARLPQPVIAAITGYALGGGCELALCADFRVCAEDAKLGQPEIALGVIPGAGGTQRLPRLVGMARAKDLIYSGRMVGAEEALRIGLVDRVVPAEQVYESAFEWARKLADGPALALRAAKRAIDDGIGLDLAAGLRLESQLFAELFATEDKRVGFESFLTQGPGKAVFHPSDK